MKLLKTGYILIGALVSVYLLLPGAKLPPPDLPDSLKSDLPGDTIQLSNVSAYFTDNERGEITGFYQDYFSRSSFFNIPLPVIKLNHPPEHAKEVIRDTTQTYYLEELVNPLKGSLFINGFEWEKDVFTPVAARGKNAILIDGKTWKAKITLRWFPQSVLLVLGVFWASWFFFWLILGFWIKEIRDGMLKLRKEKK